MYLHVLNTGKFKFFKISNPTNVMSLEHLNANFYIVLLTPARICDRT